MKRSIIAGIVCAVSLWGSSVPAADDPPLHLQGWQLFGSTKLGTSGTSCANCHTDSSKLKGAITASDEELASTINRCITGPLKGKALDPASKEMKALLLYTRSLAKTAK
jgi:cytochrome c